MLSVPSRLLAWEPGTGKTRAVLEAFSRLSPHGRRMPVIVPANVRTQWASVATEYGFDVHEITKTTEEVSRDSEIVVVSYEGVIAPIVWKSLMRYEYDALTLDELHAAKNPTAKRTKAIFGARKNTPAALIKRAEHIWGLSGTPMTKDPSDLWVAVSRLFPSILEDEGIKNRQEWIARWCEGYETPYGFKITGARNPERLHELLTPFMSRVRKRDVLPDYQEPIYDRFRLPPRKIEISDAVDSELREFLQALENLTDADDNSDVIELAEGMDPQVSTLRRAIGLSKAGEIADSIATELEQTGEKAIVFFLHTDVGHTIAKHLSEVGLEPVIYDGKMSRGQRDRNKDRFIRDPTCRVFVGQIQSAGTGTDGLQIASRVFIAEEPWTPGLLDQVISRADRGGQEAQVYATSFVVAGSYDEAVSKALETRGRIVKAVTDGEAFI
jgi:SNF2 family DNA or RNA helicase